MKKMLAAMFVLGAIAFVPAASHAECTGAAGPIANACADESGVTVDGDAGNADPFDGYVQLNTDGSLCFDDNGGATPEEQEGDCYTLDDVS